MPAASSDSQAWWRSVDSITQAMLGATIAEAGFRRKLGGRAVVFGALCGLLPDLDILVGFAGEWATLVHHRGFSHSLLVLPLVAPLIGWLGYRWSRRAAPFRRWVYLAWWALLTHPLLDVCTTYGTQLLWPISNTRFAIDAVAIIDPLYSGVLLLALILGRWRLLPARTRQVIAATALAVTTGYLILGFAQSRRAVALADSQFDRDGTAVGDVRVIPTLANIWVWRVVARDTAGNLRIGHVSTWSKRATVFQTLEVRNGPLIEAARESPRGQVFNWFAMGLVSASTERHGQGSTVYLRDQRYGMLTRPTEGLFGAAFRFDDSGELLEARRMGHNRRFDWRAELSATWHLLVGRAADSS